ncbi:hypothetical protein Tco_0266276 [Tanacetum coccineum]
MITATETRIAIIGVQADGMIKTVRSSKTIQRFHEVSTINKRFCQRNIYGPQNSTRISSKKSSSFNPNLKTKFDRLADKQSGRPSGSLPSNTQPNPRGSNSKAYQPPQARNEHVNAVFTRSGKSYNPPDNPDDQQNNSQNAINFDSDDEDDEPTPQPKTQPAKPVKETP